MKLYYSPGACALATQIILRELNLPFELVKVDLKTKSYDGGDYRNVNPKGYVPTLELDDGTVFTEGAVILQRLADQHPEKNLLAAFGTKERYQAMEWLNFIATELHKSIGSLFSTFYNEEARQGIIAKLQIRLGYLNDHLTQHTYLQGKEFSVADAYLYNVLRWTKIVQVDISQHKAILGFMENLAKRPSVVESVAAEGIKLT